jgi:hypothetical protein
MTGNAPWACYSVKRLPEAIRQLDPSVVDEGSCRRKFDGAKSKQIRVGDAVAPEIHV